MDYNRIEDRLNFIPLLKRFSIQDQRSLDRFMSLVTMETEKLSIDELRKQFEHNFNNMNLSKDTNCNYMHHDTRLKWIGYYRCAVNNKLVKGVK